MELKEQMQSALEYINMHDDDIERIASHLATLAAAHYGKEWLPIADAPKDGTRILSWSEEDGILSVEWVGGYENLWAIAYDKSRHCTYSDGGCTYYHEAFPTHFMHLPKPPVP